MAAASTRTAPLIDFGSSIHRKHPHHDGFAAEFGLAKPFTGGVKTVHIDVEHDPIGLVSTRLVRIPVGVGFQRIFVSPTVAAHRMFVQTMTTNTLEPIDPRDAYELYLADCRGELSPNTVEAKKYRLGFFVRWCEGEDNDGDPRVINLNRLSGRDLLRYKNWRQDGINTVTLKTQLSELREFLRFCVSIDAVDESLPEKVTVPSLEPGENIRESHMDPDEATTILSFLEQYHYASFDHVLMLLLWQTGARVAGIRGLDVDDINPDDETIELRHRPDDGTRLKNGEEGERIVAVPTETIAVVEDYIDVNRYPVTDDYRREPLFATKNGRMGKQHVSKHVYKWTCPCQYNQQCPADKDPMECEYTGGYDSSVECPHNTRPHDIRRGAITHWLKRDVPDRAISDRMNVSVATLDRHYDARSEEERAEQRRQYLSDVQATDGE